MTGSFRIHFDQNITLDAFIDNSLPWEHWRLLHYAADSPHFVVTGDGIDDNADEHE
jgi:hypothetical protein